MKNDCLFCAIVEGEIPSSKVYENDTVYAFRDIEPAAPQHVLIVPKEHIESLNDKKAEAVARAMFAAAREIAGLLGVTDSGYRAVINTGKDGGQSVQHLHMHILGGRNLSWPPG